MQYRRGDYLRLHFDKPVYREQFVVAADNPEINKHAWIICADNEDWLQVGKFVTTSYVEKHSPVLMHRALYETEVEKAESTLRGKVHMAMARLESAVIAQYEAEQEGRDIDAPLARRTPPRPPRPVRPWVTTTLPPSL